MDWDSGVYVVVTRGLETWSSFDNCWAGISLWRLRSYRFIPKGSFVLLWGILP